MPEAEKLAAQIMIAIRQARFPAEYYAEAHDEFESLVLKPMLAQALANERDKAFEEAAIIAYRVCAETRHVTLGREAAAAIRARQAPGEGS